ncbi:hypothetical protein [Bacillus litorisediminis]|uniref:hypothetical protein n=1 Tax=Bacillus litorisediminis TaxID=2922713 RepID=UPI001FAF83D6|nr:hypothetical protein [Bacillus litorisediminis]
MDEKKIHKDLQQLIKDKPMSKESYIEGKGTVREYGELDLEKLVKRLLQSKYITSMDDEEKK